MSDPMTPNVSLADLLAVIGEKEVTIYALRSEVASLKQRLAEVVKDGPPAES